MIIPKDDKKRLDFYREVSEVCLASRSTRLERYGQNRRYYLYGTTDGTMSPWNKIYSHLDTVTSFLYASDSTRFSAKLGLMAPSSDYPKAPVFAKKINEAWKQSNADIIFQQAILWALVYDTTIVKHIRRGKSIEPFLIDPGSFGVYREDVPMLDRQEAFVQVYYMTKSDLSSRLALHPRRDDILKNAEATMVKQDTAAAMPPLMQRVTINSMLPAPNMSGEVNVNLTAIPEYNAEIATDVVEMHEQYIWNSEIDDYQVVTMAGGQIVVYDRPNFFMPRSTGFEPEHGFVQVCPNPLYDYFWGVSEVSRLSTLQDRRNSRMDDITRLLAKQVDPPSAWGGMGLPEEKLRAFNEPGAALYLGDAMNMKRETFSPNIPQDIYADVRQIDQEFDDVSGLTNTLSGRGESGVRSGGHAQRLLTVGSSRPKKRALIIEDSLEKSADLYGKCIYVGDDAELMDEDGHKFVIAQMSTHFSVEVDAHSNSPVFTEDQMQKAEILLKAKCIDRETFVKMVNPPMQEAIIHNLKTKIIPGEQKAAEARQQAEAAAAAKKDSSKQGK